MALVSMKTDDNGCTPCSHNEYGYGLCINLNDDQCEALGIKTPLAAGAVVMISAKAFATSVTQSVEGEGAEKKPEIRMSLQITDMELKAGGLFENSNMEP